MTYRLVIILLIVPLTIFFAHFTTHYMQYFDIGINDSTRFIDIYWIRIPVAIIAQVAVMFLGNKYIGDIRWRTILHLAILFIAIGLAFIGFALFDSGIVREGGFFRFLGYYFFNLPPGQIPKGT